VTIAIVAVGVGALVQGTTGFAFALIATPVLLAVTSPEQSVSAMAILSNVVVIPTLAIRPQVVRLELVMLVLWGAPGLIVGAVALRHAPELALRIVLAAGILIAVAMRLSQGAGPARTSAAAAGFLTGALTTSIGVNGPPLVIHLLRRGLSPPQMRGTLSAMFVALYGTGVGVLAVAGSLELPPKFGLLIGATALGAIAGRAVAGTLDGEAFERIVLALLVASAVLALVA